MALPDEVPDDELPEEGLFEVVPEDGLFEEVVPEEGFEADPADGLEAEPDDGFSVSAGVSSRGLTVILTGASVEFPLSSVATRIMLYSPGFEKSGCFLLAALANLNTALRKTRSCCF